MWCSLVVPSSIRLIQISLLWLNFILHRPKKFGNVETTHPNPIPIAPATLGSIVEDPTNFIHPDKIWFYNKHQIRHDFTIIYHYRFIITPWLSKCYPNPNPINGDRSTILWGLPGYMCSNLPNNRKVICHYFSRIFPTFIFLVVAISTTLIYPLVI
jgi:hypothetical protein